MWTAAFWQEHHWAHAVWGGPIGREPAHPASMSWSRDIARRSFLVRLNAVSYVDGRILARTSLGPRCLGWADWPGTSAPGFDVLVQGHCPAQFLGSAERRFLCGRPHSGKNIIGPTLFGVGRLAGNQRTRLRCPGPGTLPGAVSWFG